MAVELNNGVYWIVYISLLISMNDKSCNVHENFLVYLFSI